MSNDKFVAAKRAGQWVVTINTFGRYLVNGEGPYQVGVEDLRDDRTPTDSDHPPFVVTVGGDHAPVIQKWGLRPMTIGYQRTVDVSLDGADPYLSPAKYAELLERYKGDENTVGDEEDGDWDEEDEIEYPPEYRILTNAYRPIRDMIEGPTTEKVRVKIVPYIEDEDIPEGLTLHRQIGGLPTSRMASLDICRWFEIAAGRAMAGRGLKFRESGFKSGDGEWSVFKSTAFSGFGGRSRYIALFVEGDEVYRTHDATVRTGEVETMVIVRDELTRSINRAVDNFFNRRRSPSPAELSEIYRLLLLIQDKLSKVKPYQKSRVDFREGMAGLSDLLGKVRTVQIVQNQESGE